MLKKLGAIFSLLIILVGLAVTLSQPIFKNLSSTFEVYLNQASSLADIRTVSEKEYYLLTGIKGESVQLSLTDFSLEELLQRFEAVVKFEEQTSDSLIYYAYSPKIRFQKRVNGEIINLHVVISGERVVLGSPLIFGSF